VMNVERATAPRADRARAERQHEEDHGGEEIAGPGHEKSPVQSLVDA
jgi:hypothetical protein